MAKQCEVVDQPAHGRVSENLSGKIAHAAEAAE
jgi:hypothetical protein